MCSAAPSIGKGPSIQRPLLGHSGHGRTRCWPAPVAIDPNRTSGDVCGCVINTIQPARRRDIFSAHSQAPGQDQMTITSRREIRSRSRRRSLAWRIAARGPTVRDASDRIPRLRNGARIRAPTTAFRQGPGGSGLYRRVAV
jgi:hypothetical protein